MPAVAQQQRQHSVIDAADAMCGTLDHFISTQQIKKGQR